MSKLFGEKTKEQKIKALQAQEEERELRKQLETLQADTPTPLHRRSRIASTASRRQLADGHPATVHSYARAPGTAEDVGVAPPSNVQGNQDVGHYVNPMIQGRTSGSATAQQDGIYHLLATNPKKPQYVDAAQEQAAYGQLSLSPEPKDLSHAVIIKQRDFLRPLSGVQKIQELLTNKFDQGAMPELIISISGDAELSAEQKKAAYEFWKHSVILNYLNKGGEDLESITKYTRLIEVYIKRGQTSDMKKWLITFDEVLSKIYKILDTNLRADAMAADVKRLQQQHPMVARHYEDASPAEPQTDEEAAGYDPIPASIQHKTAGATFFGRQQSTALDGAVSKLVTAIQQSKETDPARHFEGALQEYQREKNPKALLIAILENYKVKNPSDKVHNVILDVARACVHNTDERELPLEGKLRFIHIVATHLNQIPLEANLKLPDGTNRYNVEDIANLIVSQLKGPSNYHDSRDVPRY